MPSHSFLRTKKTFSSRLLAWYSKHARDLPWRKTHDPYRIAVSELMLQQTQVERVVEKYNEWMRLFPTVRALADADTKTIIAAWQGLGYNRRALYLQKIAQTVVNEYGGTFPQTKDELIQLPGIGPYTAGAITSFAFHADEPIVDTNVKRVIGRIFLGYKKLRTVSDEKIWSLSTSLLPKRGKTYFFNQALMDFGARICTQKKPACSVCPFQHICTSYPAILNAKPGELRLPKVNETLYFGQPRRIWRGKILAFLHQQPNRSITLEQIGKAIQNDFSPDRLPWLQAVVDTLVKDGLAKQHKSRVSLP